VCDELLRLVAHGVSGSKFRHSATWYFWAASVVLPLVTAILLTSSNSQQPAPLRLLHPATPTSPTLGSTFRYAALHSFADPGNSVKERPFHLTLCDFFYRSLLLPSLLRAHLRQLWQPPVLVGASVEFLLLLMPHLAPSLVSSTHLHLEIFLLRAFLSRPHLGFIRCSLQTHLTAPFRDNLSPIAG
jgi:hypothetical protein